MSLSNTIQTGIEIVCPDFLPITLILICSSFSSRCSRSNVQLRFEGLQILPVDTSTAPICLHLLPGHLQVLPLATRGLRQSS